MYIRPSYHITSGDQQLPDRRSIEPWILHHQQVPHHDWLWFYGIEYLVSATCFERTQVSSMNHWPWAGIQTSDWPDSRGLLDTWTFSPITNLPPLYFATIQGGKRSLLGSWSASNSFVAYAGVMDIARSRWFWFVRYLRRDYCSEALNSSNLRSPGCTWKKLSVIKSIKLELHLSTQNKCNGSEHYCGPGTTSFGTDSHSTT